MTLQTLHTVNTRALCPTSSAVGRCVVNDNYFGLFAPITLAARGPV